MGWDRVKPTIKELSAPPSLSGWLLAGLLALIVAVLLFILHASGTVKLISIVNIWWLSLTPVGAWFMLFCLRGWLWGKEIDEYQFQQKEKEYGQQHWEAWAERYLAVLKGGIYLPNGVNAGTILLEDKGIPSQFTLSCRISAKSSDEATLIKYCLASVQTTIKSLPSELPLKVTLLTDIPMQCEPESLFSCAWRDLFPGVLVPGEISTATSLSMSWVEARLKQPILSVDLILVLQLHGKNDYSDGLAALILTSDDVAQKYQLAHCARLLRPMRLDIGRIKDDFSLFLDTQTSACLTSRLLCDREEWCDISAELLTAGAEKKAGWLPEEIITLEKSTGVPGPAGQWLLTALASEIAECRNMSILTLFATETEYFVSSVIPGNENG